MKPICAILDHPLAFSGELTKVRSKNRGGNDCSRHSLSRLQEKNGTGILGLSTVIIVTARDTEFAFDSASDSGSRIANSCAFANAAALCVQECLWSAPAAKTQAIATRSLFSPHCLPRGAWFAALITQSPRVPREHPLRCPQTSSW